MSDSGSPTKIETGPTHEVWGFKATTARVDWSRPGIVTLAVVGHGHAELVPPILRRWDDCLRTNGRITVCSDYSEMPTYDSALRVVMTEWAVKHRDRLEPCHMLVRSRLVAMGMSVANLALGGILKTYTQRAAFELAVQKLGARPRLGASR